MEYPVWYKDATPSERVHFLLGICATHATKEGRLVDLAMVVGFNPSLPAYWKKTGFVPMKWAALIESHVGRDVMKWETLARPGYQE